jgi:hypothetical protein
MNHVHLGATSPYNCQPFCVYRCQGNSTPGRPFCFGRSLPQPFDLRWTHRKAELDNKLRLGPRTARMRAIGVTTKLNLLILRQLQRLLELLPNLHQRLLSRAIAALALTHRPRPQADTEEGLAHIDDDTHDFVVVVFLESFADGGQLGVEPEFVDIDAFLVFELVGPFAAVLVLRIFPFGADAAFEEVVVGFLGELRGGGDVVLVRELVGHERERESDIHIIAEAGSYVDSPELLD